MDNYIHRMVVKLLLFTLFLIQGCSSYKIDFAKGNLLNELQINKAVTLSKEPTITLQSPLSVKVADKVEYYDVYEQKYEKQSVKTKYQMKSSYAVTSEIVFRPITTLLIFPLFGDNYWYYGVHNCAKESDRGIIPKHCEVSDQKDIEIIPNEYVFEKAKKNYLTKYETVTTGSVIVKVNDNPEFESKINVDGTTKINLDTFIDPFGDKKDFNIVYRYEVAGKTATISSFYTYDKAKKDALELLPLYRQRGTINKSASDFITAFNISFDFNDIKEAIKYASTETEKIKVTALMALYNSEIVNAKFAQAKDTGNLKSFIKNNPNSNHIQEAIGIIDEEIFKTAVSTHKLKEFIRNNPNSKFIHEARTLKMKTDEEIVVTEFSSCIENQIKKDVSTYKYKSADGGVSAAYIMAVMCKVPFKKYVKFCMDNYMKNEGDCNVQAAILSQSALIFMQK